MDVVAASVNPIVTASGTIDLGITGVADPSISHQVFGGAKALSPTSTPPVTKSWEGVVALSGGAATIDLTALDMGNMAAALDLTGLKVQCISVRGDSAITVAIVATVATSNGYDIHGSGADSEIFVVEADGECMILKNDEAPDVGVAQAEITLAGTGVEEIHIMILAG